MYTSFHINMNLHPDCRIQPFHRKTPVGNQDQQVLVSVRGKLQYILTKCVCPFVVARMFSL